MGSREIFSSSAGNTATLLICMSVCVLCVSMQIRTCMYVLYEYVLMSVCTEVYGSLCNARARVCVFM